MFALMEWDVEGKEPPKLYSHEEMEAARKMIADEARQMAEEEGIEPKLDAQMWQVISNCSSELARHHNRFTRLSNLNKKDQIEVLAERFKVGILT
jgi:glycerol-3-phosphate O-acyltransferase